MKLRSDTIREAGSRSLPGPQTSPNEVGPKNLTITDALTYLDAVKFQFRDQLHVYDKFLGIMKDFKMNESVQTVDVMEHIVTLIYGYPSLIQGFNTFLPTGFGIEFSESADPRDDNYITITTPNDRKTISGSGKLIPLPPNPDPDLNIFMTVNNKSQVLEGGLDEGNSKLSPPSLNPSFSNMTAEDLTGYVIRDNDYPAHGRSYADVFQGFLVQKKDETVAIKVIRAHIYSTANQWKIDKRLRREIRLWTGLRHPNIVPLLGTVTNFGPYAAMICPWMKEGTLNHYLDDNRSKLNLGKRLQILVDVAEGLQYLHMQSIIHGDLTTANILMDEGNALLSDFGLSNVMAEARDTSFLTSTVGGAPRWTAPELLSFSPESITVTQPELTKRCDIYSFGCVSLQVITGKIPYANIASDMGVLVEIMHGKNPVRPHEPLLSDPFWDFIDVCLNRNPLMRPEVAQVLGQLRILRLGCNSQELAANILESKSDNVCDPGDEGQMVID